MKIDYSKMATNEEIKTRFDNDVVVKRGYKSWLVDAQIQDIVISHSSCRPYTQGPHMVFILPSKPVTSSFCILVFMI